MRKPDYIDLDDTPSEFTSEFFGLRHLNNEQT
jgi:hypothetical protein